MLKIVITNEKGGTGKSTLAVLLVEYLNYKGHPVQLIDTDPLQTAVTWLTNCQVKGRVTLAMFNPEFQIIDTPGSTGSAQTWIREADLVVVPLQMHYADLKVACDWFQNLRDEIQSKIVFVPNRWQNTLEQREGAKQLQGLIHTVGQGQILLPLNNRPAVYAVILNGSETNFFRQSDSSKFAEALLICSQIIKIVKGKVKLKVNNHSFS